MKTLLFNISNVKFYNHYLNISGIDTDFMPLGSLSKQTLLSAKLLLIQIHDLIKEKTEEQKKYMNADIKKILELETVIAKKSSRFYELIP